jgi:phosphohistidine phosphatase SixA
MTARARRSVLAVLAAATLGVLAAAPPALGQGTVVTGEAAWRLLQRDGAVALVRHGRTAGGAGDPPGFALEDCATQRNLTDEGRAQSRALGEAVRARGVKVAQVLSSRWCRCLETARLAFDRAEPWAMLDNLFGNPGRVAERTDALRQRAAAWTGPGALIVVTHGASILPLTGTQPAEGELLVVARDAGGEVRVIGRVASGQ